ncbi:TMhelix containing protein [Vibrio phage 1.101.O._10N.261.45.C6]|nr:TMhelix containing protein [Vibrio phage 1.101.O._10N.261.45.C6]
MNYKKEIATGLITLLVLGVVGLLPLYSKVEANSDFRTESKQMLIVLDKKLDLLISDVAVLKENQNHLISGKIKVGSDYDSN